MSDLTTQITEMIAPVADLDPSSLNPESRFEDIDDWSSLKALSLMVNVEQDLPVKLDLRRFMSVRTVGELVDLIAEGLGHAAETER
ncbi:acyl carrier protein [Micromonospora sp. CPCC 205558]|uniref:acyl carrier protein n=1 Tax=Micromonospora sp. CPCC 205558 TaxID=3122403 RepID=UPI002FEEAC19